MTTKEKVTLTHEQETLLIPLYSKAQETPLLSDETARQILEQVDYDFSQLKVPKKTVVTLLIRASQLDVYTRRFLANHPEAVVLHLGCGLDSRCRRVSWQDPRTDWYDLDMPDVIDLRRKFYPETEHYHLIASSVTDLDWTHQVVSSGRPVFVVAEGLLMYLSEIHVRALFLRLHEQFPGCELTCDAFSRLTAKRVGAHPSLRKTGATIQWGIDDPREIETWAPGIAFMEEWFFDQAPDLDRLSWLFRSMFRLSGAIPTARKAQRLLYYRLGADR